MTSDSEIRACCASLQQFSVLAMTGVQAIEHLSVHDLDTLLRTGRELMVSFQSDFDKCTVWKKLKLSPDEPEKTEASREKRT